MTLIASDPLALVAIEAGLVPAPLATGAAEGSSQLDSKQRAAVIGEPVPIVFCRRDEASGTGGVLVSPPATEARFENDSSNAVTAYYHLVLSEGRLGSIQVRDVFQRSCRVGAFTQTYSRRAGEWLPGNYITALPGYEEPLCPYYCGTGGSYEGMTTLSFNVTIPDGFDLWNRQVHAFVRNGMEVPRLVEGTTGSSNNYADLVRWSHLNAAKVPASMIDEPALTVAANFLAVNQFNCDILISKSENLADFIAKAAPYFLLTETRNNGKRGLRPLLQINEDFTINTSTIEPVFTFTEDHVAPDGLEVTFVDLVDRKSFCVQAIWRQQLTDDFGIIRTSEVRYEGEAETGPYEQHDLSAFATREDHAVKAAAYVRARRKHITHSARLTCRPLMTWPALTPGDIVRILLPRRSTWAPDAFHDYLYEVNRISRGADGGLQFDLTHFPVDREGRSLVALDVVAAAGSGIMLSSSRTGISCDINSSTDTSVPDERYRNVTPADEQVKLPRTSGGGGGGTGGGGGGSGIPGIGPGGIGGVGGSQDYEPHATFPAGEQPGIGTALYPYSGASPPCGLNQTKALTWYKDGVKIATVKFDSSGNVTGRIVAPGQRMPTWLADAPPGTLEVGVGGSGIYTSVHECRNGTKIGYQTTVSAVSKRRNFEFRYGVGGGTEINSIYTSEGTPPYVTAEEGYYRIWVYSISAGGWINPIGGALIEYLDVTRIYSVDNVQIYPPP